MSVFLTRFRTSWIKYMPPTQHFTERKKKNINNIFTHLSISRLSQNICFINPELFESVESLMKGELLFVFLFFSVVAITCENYVNYVH